MLEEWSNNSEFLVNNPELCILGVTTDHFSPLSSPILHTIGVGTGGGGGTGGMCPPNILSH